MHNVIAFTGQLHHGVRIVHATLEDGSSKPLSPETNEAFSWGHMGASVAGLAKAMAALMPGEASQALTAQTIQRQFLAWLQQNEPWEIPAEQIRIAVARRQSPQVSEALS